MPNTAQFVLDRLTGWGIIRVSGNGVNSLLRAFHEVGDQLELIQARHVEIASFAARAHAELTGQAECSEPPLIHDAITAPELSPLSPQLKFEQVKKLGRAPARDPHTGRIIKESLTGKVEEFITR